ncbi:MAG: O-antigen ligase family protein, partial [Clostridia bacterium]|nr:O-antigen ligase family protein [Clostridia bacterium]
MLSKIRACLFSPYYSLFIFLLSATSFLFGDTVLLVGMMIEVQLVALVLCLSDDLAPTLLPVLSLIVLGTTLIGRMQIVMPLVPYAFTAVIAFFAHFLLYGTRKAISPGRSLPGLLAVAAAILFSGIGNRDDINYADPTSLYYLLAMSIGLIVLYFVFSCEVKRENGRDRMHHFLHVLCYVGGLCAFIIVVNLVKWLFSGAGGQTVNEYYELIPYRNTIANLLTLCLPAPFYFAGYALKHQSARVSMFLVGCIFYSAMLMTIARTAMLFGTLVLICCLVYYLRGKGEWYFKLAGILIVLLGVSVVGFSVSEPIIKLFTSRLDEGLASVGEARWQFLVRSFSDFLEHPLFGIGYVSFANADVYTADGCIPWYHLYFPQ